MAIQKIIQKILLSLMLLTTAKAYTQKVVHYDLHIKDTTVNFTGKLKRAIAVNAFAVVNSINDSKIF